MPTTKQITRKSSRLGTKEYKSPPPLRFKTVTDAKKHIRANKAKVTETNYTRRGARITIVYPDGKARTISIEMNHKEGS